MRTMDLATEPRNKQAPNVNNILQPMHTRTKPKLKLCTEYYMHFKLEEKEASLLAH